MLSHASHRLIVGTSRSYGQELGIVLPIAMIMVVIVSLAGLLAARNSASYEQFSNNLRTNQVARQAAEVALRHCERVVIDLVENEGKSFSTDAAKVLKDTDKVTSVEAGAWNTKTNWVGKNRIDVTPTYSTGVPTASKLASTSNPSCIAQQLGDDRFIVTARGLSLDAAIDSTTGALTRGAEVWLQSIMVPGIPEMSTAGGPK